MILTILIWILVIIAVILSFIVIYIGPSRIKDTFKAINLMSNDVCIYSSTEDDVVEVFMFATSQQRRRILFYIESKKYGKLRHYLNECLRIHDEWKSGQ